MKPAKILYFVDGPAPTSEDFQKAADLAATVVFRNARAVPSEEHSLEICDGVTGHVPAIYAAKYPKADEAIAKKKAELSALTSKVGDAPAPKPSGKGAQAAQTAPQGNGKGAAPAQPQTPATAPQAGGKPAAWNPNPAQ